MSFKDLFYIVRHFLNPSHWSMDVPLFFDLRYNRCYQMWLTPVFLFLISTLLIFLLPCRPDYQQTGFKLCRSYSLAVQQSPSPLPAPNTQLLNTKCAVNSNRNTGIWKKKGLHVEKWSRVYMMAFFECSKHFICGSREADSGLV